MTSPEILVVQHQDDCPPAWVGHWLVEAGCRLDVRHPYAGDRLPDDLAGHDGYLVLGGSMGAHDDEQAPWLPGVRALVRDAVERRTPALGICLGHQLLAAALDGESRPNPLGQQLGLLAVGWTDAAGQDPLASGLVGTGYGVFWNDDVVVRAPAGTEVLARTPAGELQVARFAPTAWGLQLHPEVDEKVLSVWAEDDRDRYDDGVLGEVIDRVVEHRDELATGWRPLATAFAELCVPAH
jgi:GMP synthase (glutamine-hydrolysing)